jgi:methylmalonyl-CoA mutase cobalamin-binding subunit
VRGFTPSRHTVGMARRRIVVGGFDADRARDVARRLRDGGDEVVLLGSDLDTDELGRAAVAEDATEVVVASENEAVRVHEWLNERGSGHVTVRPVGD